DSVKARFTVADTGIGIEPAMLPRIFERFQQANDFTTRFYGGTGLGLNIVRSLTELQGGSVAVDSVLGEGSQFTVEITYQIAQEQFEQELTQLSAMPPPRERTVRVLVVEDNLINQKLILQVLKRLGYQTQIADNGEKALDLLQNNTFDIILMDIQMPVMDGYETTRHIRTKLKSSIPIIAMTAHALASEREECLKTGMNDFLPKPFQVDDLRRLMLKYLPNEELPYADTSAQETANPSTANFSVESLASAVGNDMDLATELLGIYLSETPEELENLKQALQEADLATAGRIIHTQKVHTKMLGMNEATRLILESEELIRSGKGKEAVAPLIAQYIAEVEAVLPAIRHYLTTNSKPTA
uniref:response regulator n=1 Tax=Spirosoma sp. TaxID=1899569 RepID=UPI003B3A89AD